MTSIVFIWFSFASIHLFFLVSVSIKEQNIKCIEKERLALLSFKQGLVDELDKLSSWDTRANLDCCNWRGVYCSNASNHHVNKLDLHGLHLWGEVGSSLTQLSHLNYLDLSDNYFYQIALKDIGSLINLNYLNLSYNVFLDVIPSHLGNLSKLSILDLHENRWSNDNFSWLSPSFSSLQHLDLSFVDFRLANDWASAINKLPALQSLSLRDCNLSNPFLQSHSNSNFSRFLVELDLSRNYNLNSSSYHSWLLKFTNLVHLNLGFTNLQGLNLDDFGNMTSLVFLNLTSTKINNSRSLKFFKNVFNLNSLDLSQNNIEGLLSDVLKAFPPRVLYSFQSLKLASNKFNGSFPNFTMLPCLKRLDLSDNMLSGTIPQSLGQLSSLVYLGLRKNLFEGEVSETHFSNLTHLKYLDLSRNSLKLNFMSDWVPSFQLETILLASCKLGPLFPKWLQIQNNFTRMDISFAGISDTIPSWFWNNLHPNITFLNLSGNKMMGKIPNLSLKLNDFLIINLELNKFVGRIPAFLFQGISLSLSNNKFSDLSRLCEIINSTLVQLDLSNNQLSGQLPNCWGSMKYLGVLNLSNNHFSGELPHSMSNLDFLDSLILRNNQFSGGLHSLSNLSNLIVIDAMNNNLSGAMPSWIGSKFPYLGLLNLKSNHFNGNLPLSLCNLTHIRVLDISSNNFSGSIPNCIHNFNAMTLQENGHEIYPNFNRIRLDALFNAENVMIIYVGQERRFNSLFNAEDLVMTYKGQQRRITSVVLQLQRSIDLSCNHLTGKIPNEITELVGLINLNLSNNELTDQIPSNIGQLQSLESLDLSRNQLCGPIPSSLSQISRLPILNLSYNNLSGKIPTGTQLQSFPTSSYEGNPCLCGEPLKKCFEEISPNPNINNEDNVRHVHSENEDSWFVLREIFISMTFGYIVGFWGIFGSLLLRRRWRHTYFNFFKRYNPQKSGTTEIHLANCRSAPLSG